MITLERPRNESTRATTRRTRAVSEVSHVVWADLRATDIPATGEVGTDTAAPPAVVAVTAGGAVGGVRTRATFFEM